MYRFRRLNPKLASNLGIESARLIVGVQPDMRWEELCREILEFGQWKYAAYFSQTRTTADVFLMRALIFLNTVLLSPVPQIQDMVGHRSRDDVRQDYDQLWQALVTSDVFARMSADEQAFLIRELSPHMHSDDAPFEERE
ncbi:MAG TPA: hypothetical protein PLN52_01740 [Opitutaceae bacterium]|nr:hypothetical protein [Opitutaceae bacterium]